MARLKEIYKKEIVPALIEAVRVQVGDAGAAHREDRRSTWAWARRPRDKKVLDNAVGDMRRSPARSR